MGSLTYELHWQRLVCPSVHQFLESEDLLQISEVSGDADFVRHTGYETLRLGMVSAIFLYHFSEVVLERNALAGRTPPITNKTGVRKLISKATHAADGDPRPDDYKIIGEVADAVKHAELTSEAIVHVPKKGRVIEISQQQPTLFPEGQPAGTPQVLIVTKAGSRSLRALVENVARGWVVTLGVAAL
ncbi:hypothetical protein GOZ83_06510 [Agrobacterium vitis]|uniref:hypothetical protein n=1 Tax=Rhizobium/Agrobacterium group TaxID=227290 RepID=UPI0012E74111|nr:MULTISPECIES: hypothetical protein [Rhizobium/Agrobacterium group]MCF1495866.1 hypothetical protein [Allorhizobium ampelinum]MVA44731.1 hypothetical protein [Agrobacterium vitis]